MLNNINNYFEKIDTIFKELNNQNKNFLFLPYLNRYYKRKNNNQAIEEFTNNNITYTTISLYVKQFFSENDISFNLFRYTKCQKVIVEINFQNNDNCNFDLFLKYLEKDRLKLIKL